MKANSTRAVEAEKLFGRAETARDKGRLRSAFRLMQTAARLGSSSAMCNLGYFYDCGIGTSKNRDLAMYWYKRSYRKGVAAGANNIGTIYRDEHKSKLAIGWFEKASEPWDRDPNFEIAKLYVNQLDDSEAAIPHLNLVARAKPGVSVDEDSWKEARLLLKKLSAEQPKYKRAFRG